MGEEKNIRTPKFLPQIFITIDRAGGIFKRFFLFLFRRISTDSYGLESQIDFTLNRKPKMIYLHQCSVLMYYNAPFKLSLNFTLPCSILHAFGAISCEKNRGRILGIGYELCNTHALHPETICYTPQFIYSAVQFDII